jgi:hypothetical protein
MTHTIVEGEMTFPLGGLDWIAIDYATFLIKIL